MIHSDKRFRFQMIGFILVAFLAVDHGLYAKDQGNGYTFNMQAYQLESSSTALHFLSPQFLGHSQLGLVYSFRLYPDEENKSIIGASDLGLIWYVTQDLITIEQRSLFIGTDIKLGQTSYDSKVVPEGSKDQHSFLEITLLFGLKPQSESGLNLAVGTGWRVNFLEEDYSRAYGSKTVVADIIYPILQMGYSL